MDRLDHILRRAVRAGRAPKLIAIASLALVAAVFAAEIGSASARHARAARSAVARPAVARSAAAPVTVTVGSTGVGPSVPAGFVGIATEYWNVEKEVGTNPAKPDTAFEQTVRNLAPYGNLSLRIGGDSTDWTWFPISGMAPPPWVRWTMTPAWAAVTKRLVHDLHAHLIVGINMEADNVKVTDAEVHEINSVIGGAAPITFELGNEPELYSHFPYYHDAAGAAVYGRPKSYSLSDVTSQWNQLADALPNVRFAGPGYSSLTALPYITQFLQQSNRLKLLTVHTYPLKSTRCGAARPQESQLFDSQSLQTLASGVASWTSVASKYLIGVRVDEMNSVTCGGQPGFTNSLGPALWALNILPLYAKAGVSGVNFQSRPFTAQNLIQTLETRAGWRVEVQPEYYGLLTFAKLTPPGSRILSVVQLPAAGDLLAWAVKTPQGQTHVVVTNVGPVAKTVAIKATGAKGSASVETLHGGAGGLRATNGVALGGQTLSSETGALTGSSVSKTVASTSGAYDVTVAPATAAIVTFKR